MTSNPERQTPLPVVASSFRISCGGADKLCANKLLFVKWLCIRSQNLWFPFAPRIHEPCLREFPCESWVSVRARLSMRTWMAWHYLIAHEYLSWQILPAEIQGYLPTPLPHLSHIQFIAINSSALCISYAFYRPFRSNITHFWQSLSLWSLLRLTIIT